MTSDSHDYRTYSDAMEGEGAHIRLKLDTHDPIALSDFVGSFVGIGNQFEKFIAANYPELKAESEFFVKDVRDGCIEADLVTWVQAALTGAAVVLPNLNIIDTIDKGQILAKFVRDLSKRISPYFQHGGRDPKATKGDLADYHKAVAAIARDPLASANIEAAVFETDGRNVRSAFKFKSSEAREAQRQIADHRRELEATTGKNEDRVLLKFVRPSVESSKPGKKGGERAIVASIHPKALPVIYASDMAEQRTHHEFLEAEGNVFRKLFDVDLNVERNVAGKPIAYRIMHVHVVVDDEEAA